MKAWSRLPVSRELPGAFWIDDVQETKLFGPVRCRGEADNSGAAAHSNVIEDPTRAFGDHPSGRYQITRVVWHPSPPSSYGPCFLLLDPIGGEALLAKLDGRSGLAIHGGDLGPGDLLRVTFGCLRLDNWAAEQTGHLVETVLQQGGTVEYECLLV